jgi:hypothetical protein
MAQVTRFGGSLGGWPWLHKVPVLDATVGNRQQTTLTRGSRAWTLRKVRFLPTALIRRPPSFSRLTPPGNCKTHRMEPPESGRTDHTEPEGMVGYVRVQTIINSPSAVPRERPVRWPPAGDQATRLADWMEPELLQAWEIIGPRPEYL